MCFTSIENSAGEPLKGHPLETTARLLDELPHVVEQVPEVSDYEAYAAVSAVDCGKYLCLQNLHLEEFSAASYRAEHDD